MDEPCHLIQKEEAFKVVGAVFVFVAGQIDSLRWLTQRS